MPYDLGEDYYAVARNAGARIHSDSWGDINAYSYTADSANIDTYAHANAEFLPVMAIGNDGEYGYVSLNKRTS